MADQEELDCLLYGLLGGGGAGGAGGCGGGGGCVDVVISQRHCHHSHLNGTNTASMSSFQSVRTDFTCCLAGERQTLGRTGAGRGRACLGRTKTLSM